MRRLLFAILLVTLTFSCKVNPPVARTASTSICQEIYSQKLPRPTTASITFETDSTIIVEVVTDTTGYDFDWTLVPAIDCEPGGYWPTPTNCPHSPVLDWYVAKNDYGDWWWVNDGYARGPNPATVERLTSPNIKLRITSEKLADVPGNLWLIELAKIAPEYSNARLRCWTITGTEN